MRRRGWKGRRGGRERGGGREEAWKGLLQDPYMSQTVCPNLRKYVPSHDQYHTGYNS